MDKSVISPLDQIKECIYAEQSFVLQGGAGSGKTESLKRIVEFCTENYPNKRIVCITHTNKAVDEIIDRIGPMCEASTIHSFLNKHISPYGKNILEILPELFILPLFERKNIEEYGGDLKLQNLSEHERFKKLYESLESLSLLVLGENVDKVVGKKEYDKDPTTYNLKLNEKIAYLNLEVKNSLEKHHYKEVYYNDTPFDSFKKASYGHDGLIKIASILFTRYPNFGKIICDKYDLIFIDEYQDTDEGVIRGLIYNTPANKKTILGLFGDSEQAIYESGIGSVSRIVADKKLTLIEKLDNFRCSPQVIKLANKFRADGLKQEVALKEISGVIENPEERNGSAKLFYTKQLSKPTKPASLKNNATPEDTIEYQKKMDAYEAEIIAVNEENKKRLELLISSAQADIKNLVILKLPNRFVAQDAGFGLLYDIFSERFANPREEIKKSLDRLQFGQLVEILELFEKSTSNKRSFNRLISKLKNQGLFFKSVADKNNIYTILKDLLDPNVSAYKTMTAATSAGIISISESHRSYLDRKNNELNRITNETTLNFFKSLINKGYNTELRMMKFIKDNQTPGLSEEVIRNEYDDRMRDISIEKFYNGLFGVDLEFKEILAFYRYENDDSSFMTMHKTKGTGIENVLVVLDEFNWTKYDFRSCFNEVDDNPSRQALTRRLLYVACSRAKKSLVCVRLIKDELEINRLLEYFDETIEVKVC